MSPVTPTLRVQCVSVLWTKASRGGMAAATRNAVPLGFPWPDDSAIWHKVVASEWVDDFGPVVETNDLLPQDVAWQLGLRTEPHGVSVQPRVYPNWMPTRHRRRPRVRLTTGESLRWILNYRLGLDHGWTYGQITFNVGLGTTDSSFGTQPDKMVDERASLR